MLSVLFWVFWLLALLAGGWILWPASRATVSAWAPLGILILLLAIIGLRLFPLNLR